MMRPNNIGSIGEVLAEYRKRPGQLTGSWRKDGENREKIVEIYRRQRPDLVARLVGPARAVKYQYLASNAYAVGDYAAAKAAGGGLLAGIAGNVAAVAGSDAPLAAVLAAAAAARLPAPASDCRCVRGAPPRAQIAPR